MVHIFLCMLSKEFDLTTEKAFDTKSDRFVSVDQTIFFMMVQLQEAQRTC